MKNIISQNRKTLIACSTGTILEWYDFFLFGILATTLSPHFFPSDDQRIALLYTLLAFGIAFIARPIGGIIFGHIGDKMGRKPSLMISIALMGLSSTAIGIIPSYDTIGIGASITIFILRFTQGIALGGEYSGAATYLAEQSVQGKKATITSYLQTTASIGFIFALVLTTILRSSLGEEAFNAWGWRIAFGLSLTWIIPSYYIRHNLFETKIFKELSKKAATVSYPLVTLLTKKENLRILIIAIFGITMGQGIVSYTGFYSMYFLQSYETIPNQQIDFIIISSSLLMMPVTILWGKVADKTNYATIIILGMVLCVISYIPTFRWMDHIASNYTPTNHIINADTLKLFFIVSIQKVFFTMSYAPLIALLTTLFPTPIRYSGISLSYNIGNGIFGGLFPFIATYMTIHPIFEVNYYNALIYPIVLVTISATIGIIFLPKSNQIKYS